MALDIEQRLAAIEARNKKVAADKAWETSWTRRISVFLLTYIVVVIYFSVVVHINPWVNALVPAIGFFLSTLTMSILKKQWLNRRTRNH